MPHSSPPTPATATTTTRERPMLRRPMLEGLRESDVAEEVSSFSSCSGGLRLRSVVATEPIESGEEICIPYINVADHEEKLSLARNVAGILKIDPDHLLIGLLRQSLYAKWGFWCTCPRCEPCVLESLEALERWCEIFAESSAASAPKGENDEKAGGHRAVAEER